MASPVAADAPPSPSAPRHASGGRREADPGWHQLLLDAPRPAPWSRSSSFVECFALLELEPGAGAAAPPGDGWPRVAGVIYGGAGRSAALEEAVRGLAVFFEPPPAGGGGEQIPCVPIGLTDVAGERLYAFCALLGRRALCLLSAYPALAFARDLLRMVCEAASSPAGPARLAAAALHTIASRVPPPLPGLALSVRPGGGGRPARLSWAAASPLPEDASLAAALSLLNNAQLVGAWRCLLVEAKVCVVGEAAAALLPACELLASLLLPLPFCHALVPLLPPGLAAVLDAPVPCLCGCAPATLAESGADAADLCVVDLRCGAVRLPDGLPRLPEAMSATLLERLNAARGAAARRLGALRGDGDGPSAVALARGAFAGAVLELLTARHCRVRAFHRGPAWDEGRAGRGPWTAGGDTEGEAEPTVGGGTAARDGASTDGNGAAARGALSAIARGGRSQEAAAAIEGGATSGDAPSTVAKSEKPHDAPPTVDSAQTAPDAAPAVRSTQRRAAPLHAPSPVLTEGGEDAVLCGCLQLFERRGPRLVWAELDEVCLRLYDHADDAPRTVLRAGDLRAVAPSPREPEGLVFEITARRPFRFYAASEEARERWIAALEAQIRAAAPPSASPDARALMDLRLQVLETQNLAVLREAPRGAGQSPTTAAERRGPAAEGRPEALEVAVGGAAPGAAGAAGAAAVGAAVAEAFRVAPEAQWRSPSALLEALERRLRGGGAARDAWLGLRSRLREREGRLAEALRDEAARGAPDARARAGAAAGAARAAEARCRAAVGGGGVLGPDRRRGAARRRRRRRGTAWSAARRRR